MSDTIKVALVDLGRIGQQFTDRFSEHVASGDKSIMIIAVAEKDLASAAAKRFLEAGVPVYEDATKIVDLGDSVDIIFDLTGNSDLRKILRERLHDSDNRHTVIAPEIMVRLLGHSSGTWHYPAQFLTVIPTEKGTANFEME